jgi:hypothetical protein
MDLVARNMNKALDDLQKAVNAMVLGNGQQYRGSVYRDQWFAQIRSDDRLLRESGVPGTLVADFFDQVRGDQALVDILDAANFKTLPTPKAQESGSNLVVTMGPVVKVDTSTSSAARVSFSYANLRSGDLISVSWNPTDSSAGSVPTSVLVVGQAGAPPPGSGTFALPSWVYSDGGNYVVDLALDAVPMSETRVFIPGGGSVRCVAPSTSESPNVETGVQVGGHAFDLASGVGAPAPFRRVGSPSSCLF